MQAQLDHAPHQQRLGLVLVLAGDVGRAEATFDEAKQCCLVLGALRVPVVVETRITDVRGLAQRAAS